MFAKNLEHTLHALTADGDFQRYTTRYLEERFESLRGCGRLPRGREKRAQHLTPTEITAAVLGLVPVHPAWAGHAAVVFERIQPVGGLRLLSELRRPCRMRSSSSWPTWPQRPGLSMSRLQARGSAPTKT